MIMDQLPKDQKLKLLQSMDCANSNLAPEDVEQYERIIE